MPETRLPLKPLDHEVCVIAGTRRRYVDGRASIHVLVERDVRIATSVLGTLFLGLNIHEWLLLELDEIQGTHLRRNPYNLYHMVHII